MKWPPEKTFIVAEIGRAPAGSLEKARELIESAALSGADCAKFQIVFADEILHPNTGSVPLPGGEKSLYEVFRSLEQDEDYYAALKEMTEKAGMVFLATPFGPRSLNLLKNLDPLLYKIASPELNYKSLIKETVACGKPVIFSTGVSLLADIEKAVNWAGGAEMALLHCITAYPAPEEEYNLHVLDFFRNQFSVPVGVSDHSLDPVLVPVLSMALGAVVIEKHFCISRGDSGLDDPIALDPGAFGDMVKAVRMAEHESRGSIIEEYENRYGSHRINTILGSGRKILAPSEQSNYGRTNRSLHALTDLPAGTVLSENNTAILRTEKILRPGLDPDCVPLVMGKKLTRFVPAGEGIVWEDLLDSLNI